MSVPIPPLDRSRTFSVRIGSENKGNDHQEEEESFAYVYTLTGLNDDEAQIQTWATFCANVFSYKTNPPPPSYFARHYRNDPQRCHPAFIRVAYINQSDKNENNELVASCRIFWKTLSDGSGNGSGGGSLVAAGIGEVCTRQDHRRRGLSKELLKDALDIIQSPTNQADVIVLHAAPTFFPVYQSVGFEIGPESFWKVMPIVNTRIDEEGDHSSTAAQGIHLRQAEFPKDTSELMQLHQSYSENRFTGCIRRSRAYWNDYLSEELQGRLWVCCNDKDSILGWMSIRSRGSSGRYQLCDFGCTMDLLPTGKKKIEDNPSTNSSLYLVFYFLFAKTLKQCGTSLNESASGVELHLPSSVFQEVQASFCQQQTIFGSTLPPILEFEKASDENDGGWMYKPISERAKTWLADAAKNHPHLIWPADSF